MQMMKGIMQIGMIFLLFLLFTCSVNVDEKLKDPDFISWLSGKSENELKELKKDGNFDYNYFNIKKWKTFFETWDKISEPFLTEEIKYNQFGLYDEIILKNSKGVIAEKVVFRSPYNPTQITGFGYSYPGEKKLFFVIDHQKEVKESETASHTIMFLCLDKKGRIIQENGKPKLLKVFNAKQKTTFKNEYYHGFISKTTTKIFPCENCNSENKEIGFVW